MILEAMLMAAAAAVATPAGSSPRAINCFFFEFTESTVAPGIGLKQGVVTCIGQDQEQRHQAHVSMLTADMTTPNRSVRTTAPPTTAPVSATNTADVAG